MKASVLIVDDDIRINELLREIYSMEQYEIYSALNGQEALNQLEEHPDIDLIILDVMMPELSGWDILPYIKEMYDAKVLILTALSDTVSEVKGLREGADDYVSKPFSRAVLLERSRKLISQRQEQAGQEYRFEGLSLDPRGHLVKIDDEIISLTGKEYRLLLLLMSNCNQVLSREMIIEKVWGIEYDVDSRNVDTQIKMLRHSIRDYGKNIRTVRGIGYCFDGEVEHL